MAGVGAGAGSLWNKNSWHWEEKKYTAWAHNWIKENLPTIRVENSDASARITSVTHVSGDVRGLPASCVSTYMMCCHVGEADVRCGRCCLFPRYRPL